MSLPKRDGVQGRYYLIQKPDTNPEVLEHADQCIQDVLDGTAKENHSGYPVVVRNQSGTPFLPSQLLERYLSKLPLKGFPYEEAVTFCDALRRLVGSTTTLVYLMYQEGFTNNRVGYTSAMAVVFFLIVLVVSLIQNKLTEGD